MMLFVSVPSGSANETGTLLCPARWTTIAGRTPRTSAATASASRKSHRTSGDADPASSRVVPVTCHAGYAAARCAVR